MIDKKKYLMYYLTCKDKGVIFSEVAFFVFQKQELRNGKIDPRENSREKDKEEIIEIKKQKTKQTRKSRKRKR